MNKFEIRPYTGDPCSRLIPKFSFQEFSKEVDLTDGELLNYLPQPAYEMNKSFEKTKRIFSIVFWVLDIGFITYCHKIRIINRIFTNRWGMFAFKLFSIILPFWGYFMIQNSATNENHSLIYSLIHQNYCKYQYTGNILMLNPEIQIYDIEWGRKRVTKQEHPIPTLLL